MSAPGESGRLPAGPGINASDRPLYAPQRTLGYYCPEGPLVTQSGHQRSETTKNVNTAWYFSFRARKYACMIGVWSDRKKMQNE